MTKLVKFLAIGTAATAVGWAIGGVVLVVTMGRLFVQADLDDDEGGFMPRQAFERAMSVPRWGDFDIVR